ncbi:MAG: hypothetical protein AUJ49_01995 [Desulfovibrionaceae bacterium CG1_02_65_16]|nr:MAG: hypothetical protein AUJ49_01995 [Desulfovibrionaceae bacterium CG1_02_65_16]
MGKWDSWRDMDEFRQQMERLFDEARNMCGEPSAGYVWAPRADVLETPQAIIAQVELPGVRPEQVVVEIVDGDLVVRGERSIACPDPDDPTYIIMERAHGTFARRFALPPGVDSGAVTATLAEGLLTVTVLKAHGGAPGRFTLRID